MKLKSFKLDKPARIEYQGVQKHVRAGEEVFVDPKKEDYYSAYPIVVSEDVAVKYMGYEPKQEKPKEEVDGS